MRQLIDNFACFSRRFSRRFSRCFSRLIVFRIRLHSPPTAAYCGECSKQVLCTARTAARTMGRLEIKFAAWMSFQVRELLLLFVWLTILIASNCVLRLHYPPSTARVIGESDRRVWSLRAIVQNDRREWSSRAIVVNNRREWSSILADFRRPRDWPSSCPTHRALRSARWVRWLTKFVCHTTFA